MAEFSSNVTPLHQDNRNVRLDIDYETLKKAIINKERSFVWIQDRDSYGEYAESVSLNFEQAKWLVEELNKLIKMVEDDNNE